MYQYNQFIKNSKNQVFFLVHLPIVILPIFLSVSIKVILLIKMFYLIYQIINKINHILLVRTIFKFLNL